MTIDSKKQLINATPEKVFGFIGNFNNFGKMLPPQIEDLKTTEDTCSFKVSGFMQLTLKIAERIPCSKIVISPDSTGNTPMPLKITFNMAEQDSQTNTKISIDLDVNPMMIMMLKGKLQDAVNLMAEKLKYFIENQQN